MSDADTVPGGKPKLYRVAFDLPEETAAWAPAAVERLWVEKTATKMEVQVRNVPFYVKGIAFGDIVRVRGDHARRELVFEEFVSAAGNSTVRIIIKADDVRDSVAAILRRFGCSWERDNTGYLWAVDVVAKVNYQTFREALFRAKVEGWIGVEEAALARAHRAALNQID